MIQYFFCALVYDPIWTFEEDHCLCSLASRRQREHVVTGVGSPAEGRDCLRGGPDFDSCFDNSRGQHILSVACEGLLVWTCGPNMCCTYISIHHKKENGTPGQDYQKDGGEGGGGTQKGRGRASEGRRVRGRDTQKGRGRETEGGQRPIVFCGG